MSQDPLRYFRIEARELVDQISAGVLDLDQQPGPDLVARLLRFAHTLKGAARVVRQPEIADRAHAFEEVLVPHRGGAEPLPAEQMRELLRLNDEIEERVAALEPQSAPPAAPMRFPAGMTPGGPSPSTAPKPTGDRRPPGAPPEHRGAPRGSGSSADFADSLPHGMVDERGAGTPADARRATGGDGETTAGSGVGRLGTGGSDAAGGGQHQRRSTSGATAGNDSAAGGGPIGHGASAERGPSSRRAVGGRAGDESGQWAGARAAPEAGGGQAAGRGTTGDDSGRVSGGPGTSIGDLEASVETASNDVAVAGSGPAADTPTTPHGSDTSITVTSHDDSDADAAAVTDGTAASDDTADSSAADGGAADGGAAGSGTTNSGAAGSGAAGSGAAAASDDKTDIRAAPGSDPAQPVSSSQGPSPQSDSRRGSSQESRSQASGSQASGSQGNSSPQQNAGHPHLATTGTGSPTTGEEAPRSPSHPESAPASRGATTDVDELLDAVGEAHARFAPLRTGGQSLDRLTRSAEALADQLRVGRTAAHSDAARVVAARLASDLGALGRQITDTVEQVERELDEVRGRAERLRLVSASSIFTVLHRAVRDAADAQGKRVRFEGRGGDLRLDPQVLTLANNALLHVVRNAVAHGIEADEDRLAAGKPVEGSVVVTVERRGRYVAFRCTDDGRGFDLVAVRRTAEERGLLMPGGTPPDEQTLVELVLRGGISTSPTVTEVAGRGIGLDVARDVADQLGGEVSVRTEAGLGAAVELVLPLALMSLHGLVVEAAGTVATVPLDAVRTCVRLLPEQATAAAVTGKMAHDGEAVPFLSLARALYAGTTVPDGGGPTVAVIVGHDGELVAVGVDRLAGTSTLVVRPLPDLAPAAPVIGGVSMDLDGNPRLVLDAQGLVAETLRLGGGGAAPAEPVRRLPILVVDDSLTTRMLERSILESAGYEVDLAASGEEGLERARARRYGLYLTDIDMPGIDGFTFVAETRADPELAEVPAILVSSRASAEDRQRGAAVGASAYVVKGEFNQEELLAHIRRLVPA